MLSKKVGHYKLMSQAPKLHFVVFFGKDMLDITEQTQLFMVAFIWVMEFVHKICNLLCDKVLIFVEMKFYCFFILSI